MEPFDVPLQFLFSPPHPRAQDLMSVTRFPDNLRAVSAPTKRDAFLSFQWRPVASKLGRLLRLQRRRENFAEISAFLLMLLQQRHRGLRRQGHANQSLRVRGAKARNTTVEWRRR